MTVNICRYISSFIEKDLEKKMVFIGGPRQVGKTFISHSLPQFKDSMYLNWDYDEDREAILKRDWPKSDGLLVLDEIHKYKPWRNVVKGLYDKRRKDLKILVTGSARLDYYRRGGDSLQGRYFYYRLHPFSVAELRISSERGVKDLLTLGGFPEPFLSGSLKERNRWARQYRSRILKEDLQSLENVTSIGQVEQLAINLPNYVASPLSLNSLREDLGVAFDTVRVWLDILERLYFIFRISPFGYKGLRSIRKAQKHYHYDWSLVPDEGAKLENLVASHLLKWVHFVEDTEGREVALKYYRDKERREVDFVLEEEGKPIMFLECKSSLNRTRRLTGLYYLKKKFPEVRSVVIAPGYDKHTEDEEGVEKMGLIQFLNELV